MTGRFLRDRPRFVKHPPPGYATVVSLEAWTLVFLSLSLSLFLSLSYLFNFMHQPAYPRTLSLVEDLGSCTLVVERGSPVGTLAQISTRFRSMAIHYY